MTGHRGSPPRPRYGRIAAFGTATLVTVLSGLGGLGVLSTGARASAEQVAHPASYVAPTPTIARSTSDQLSLTVICSTMLATFSKASMAPSRDSVMSLSLRISMAL